MDPRLSTPILATLALACGNGSSSVTDPTCNPGACHDAAQIQGEAFPLEQGDLACRVDEPLTPLSLAAAKVDWCDSATSTYPQSSGETHSIDLQSCTDAGAARYWRATIDDECCTDVTSSYTYTWSDGGTLLHSTERGSWGSYWCCCGDQTEKVVYGDALVLTCVAADPAEVCIP